MERSAEKKMRWDCFFGSEVTVEQGQNVMAGTTKRRLLEMESLVVRGIDGNGEGRRKKELGHEKERSQGEAKR